MGRKSRHSVKTGDHKKSRPAAAARRDEEDPVYDEVERHHRDRVDDFLRLNDDDDDEEEEEEDDGITTRKEGVLDLGIPEEDESDDDDEEESGDEEPPRHEEEETDTSESEREEEGETNVFNWGTKKQSYYHGDTADLEIGQEEEDALLEEEAGQEVVVARLKEMEEGDFMLDDDDDVVKEEKVERKGKRRERALSRKDKTKLMKKSHPELMPVVDHFRGGLEEFVETTSIVGEALLREDGVGNESEAVGCTPAGLQYLITKSMLQASQALNLSLYLLLKADRASLKSEAAPTIENNDNSFLIDDDVDDIQSHPVMDRLNQLSQLSDKLRESVESKVPGLTHQMQSLVKAAALMKEEGGGSSDESSTDNESDAAEEHNIIANMDDSNDNVAPAMQQLSDANSETSSSSDSTEEDESENAIQRRILTEAKFALRNQDIENTASKTSKKKSSRLAPPSSMDYGDDSNELSERALKASRNLASTMNLIAQKSSSGKGKHNQNMGVEDEDDEYERLQRGLSMMDEEFGTGSDGGEDGGNDRGGSEDEGFGDEDEDDFYNKIKSKSKGRKEAKRQMYAVAPKYPRLEEEVEGERAIGRLIMKNRGLVAHKPKINRNPRVKKREQYRKALIRRKGAVREIRTEESHVYGGESTGIKSGISRSRKLGGGR